MVEIRVGRERLLTIGSARFGMEVRMMACMKGVVFCVIRGIIEALSRE